MLKLEIILSENDVMSISESFKQMDIGGLTITKVRGRGQKTAPEILVHKGSEVFVPHFGDKYRIMVVIPESKDCLLYTSPSPRDGLLSRMPSSA